MQVVAPGRRDDVDAVEREGDFNGWGSGLRLKSHAYTNANAGMSNP